MRACQCSWPPEWRGRAPSARAVRHTWLTGQIQAIHLASRGIYGARRVHAELTLGLGISIGHGAVEMLMHRAGIKGLPGNGRPRPKYQTPTAGDLVNRQLTRPVPDQLWVTDITEHPTREGKSYCAVVLDACTRRVVGWSIDSSQTAALVTSALDMAIATGPPARGVVIHSDHGVQRPGVGVMHHRECSRLPFMPRIDLSTAGLPIEGTHP